MNALVVIHIPSLKTPESTPEGVYSDGRLNSWGRATLASALLDEGAEVAFSRGAVAYDFETGVAQTMRLRGLERGDEGYEVKVAAEEVAIDSIHAIRNITKALGHGVPELNSPDVRAIARDKVRTNAVLSTVGLAKAYAALERGGSLDGALDQLESDAIVIKPATGKQGIGVEVTTKAELARMVREGELNLDQDMIIEERLNMHVPMPVRGINEAEQAKIDAANRDGAAKELRAFYFGDNPDGSPRLHYVMRVAQPGMQHLHHDAWVYVDQGSVPEELEGLNVATVGAMKTASDTEEIHIGIDWVRAEAPDGSDYWMPMEVNANEPQLVYENQHRPTALTHAKLLAQQLVRVAQSHPANYNKESI